MHLDISTGDNTHTHTLEKDVNSCSPASVLACHVVCCVFVIRVLAWWVGVSVDVAVLVIVIAAVWRRVKVAWQTQRCRPLQLIAGGKEGGSEPGTAAQKHYGPVNY